MDGCLYVCMDAYLWYLPIMAELSSVAASLIGDGLRFSALLELRFSIGKRSKS